MTSDGDRLRPLLRQRLGRLTRVEEWSKALLRDLVYERLMKAALSFHITTRDAPTLHCELVPAHSAELRRFPGHTPHGVVVRAWALINERYAERLTNLDFARHAGCSPSHLARAFRLTYSMTLGDLRDA